MNANQRDPESNDFQVAPGQVPHGDIFIYEFGVRLDPDCADAVSEQILKARRLYNELIAAIRQTVDGLQSFVLNRSGSEAEKVSALIGELNTKFAAAKADDNEDAMKRIAQERREQWKVLSGLMKEARKDNRTAIHEQFLSRIGNKSSCETYQLRCKAVNDGLGWGTANAVLDSALQAFRQSFALGKAPRFASGQDIDQDSLTLQFTLKGGLPVEALLAGRQADCKLQPTHGCGPRKYGQFTFRLGAASKDAYATGTWQYHRSLPEDATIGLARLIRRRVGQNYRWAIQLLVKTPEVEREEVGQRKPLATVHFGWAMDIDGRRIAAIADGADPGCATLIKLPPEIEEGLEKSGQIQAQRDAQRDEIATKVRQIDIPETVDAALLELLRRIKATRPQDVSANRLHYLCRLLDNEHRKPNWLEAWRAKDKLRWQDQTHIAKRARNRRKTYYRQLAIELGRSYETIALEPLDLAAAAKKVDEVTGEKTDFVKKARAGRVVAALYEFESALRWAATKTGAALLEVTGPTASVCAICGGTISTSNSDHQTLHCDSCGATMDRKLNGAAVAWQAVEEVREDVVERFWRELFEDKETKQQKKADTLEKKAKGRSDARAKRVSEEARTESEPLNP